MSESTASSPIETGRKPGVTFIDSTPDNGNGTESRSGENTSGIGQPEIFTFSPETVRIGDTADAADSFTGTDGIKRTRRGTIDRRTRAGRSADTGNAAQETTGKSALASLSVADLLISINGFLATITEIPEFEIDSDEAKALASAVQDVGKHYTVNIDPKKVAWANLAAVVGKLGWTRVLCYRLRKASEGEAKTVKTAPKNDAPFGPARVVTLGDKGKSAKQQTNGNAATVPSELWDEPAAVDITPGL